MLENNTEFTTELFGQIFKSSAHTAEKPNSTESMPILFHSDMVKLIKSIKHDFPEVIDLSKIGQSY